MRKTFFSLIFIAFLSHAIAQQGTLEVSGASATTYGVVRYSDPATIGQKKAETITYADVYGSPFWDDRWNPGYLILRNGSGVKLDQIRINLLTGQVHYINNSGVELVAEPTTVPKIILFKAKDTSQLLAIFEAFPDLNNNNMLFYYRVANDGKWRLMELQKAEIKVSNYDPLQGKKESRFINKSQYAIGEFNYLHPLSSLEHAKISQELKLDDAAESWLKSNKNKLKNESDVVTFLGYMNSREK
jgi:hypothetical protein